jgi:hypothetical protein
MINKPFRPPLLKRRPENGEPPIKKQKLDDAKSSNESQPAAFRRPLQAIQTNAENSSIDGYYLVLW